MCQIIQIDFDGLFTFTPVRIVELVGAGTVLFPNPNIIGQNITVVADDFRTVHVFDQFGKLVQEVNEAQPQRSAAISTSCLAARY